MRSTYDDAMRGVLAHEGGYSNDAADPGGPTKYGITLADVRRYLKTDAGADDVKALTIAQAQEIYAKHYAAPLRYDELPAGIDYAVLDYGINSGIARAGTVLRRCLKLADDASSVSEAVVAAARAADARSLVLAICDERLRFLQSLKTWDVFGNGWGRRVADVKAVALAMAAAAAAPVPPVAVLVEPPCGILAAVLTAIQSMFRKG